MTLLRRFVPVALTAMFGGAVACGGDSMGPKVGSITGMFGDNDSVNTGGTLSIGFTVLDGQGYPLKGAKVTWTVAPTTAATINPTAQTSDSIGNVSTVVRAGSAVATFTVTASLNGVAPIDFHLKSIDPCHYAAVYTLGDTVTGALSTTDGREFSGPVFYFYDYYQLNRPPGQQSIRINELSDRIDPYVEFYRSTGELLGWDDDIQPGVIQTSQFDVILGSGGSYVIGATSYDPDTTGTYTLIAKPRPTTLAGCQDAWMTPGATRWLQVLQVVTFGGWKKHSCAAALPNPAAAREGAGTTVCSAHTARAESRPLLPRARSRSRRNTGRGAGRARHTRRSLHRRRHSRWPCAIHSGGQAHGIARRQLRRLGRLAPDGHGDQPRRREERHDDAARHRARQIHHPDFVGATRARTRAARENCAARPVAEYAADASRCPRVLRRRHGPPRHGGAPRTRFSSVADAPDTTRSDHAAVGDGAAT